MNFAEKRAKKAFTIWPNVLCIVFRCYIFRPSALLSPFFFLLGACEYVSVSSTVNFFLPADAIFIDVNVFSATLV